MDRIKENILCDYANTTGIVVKQKGKTVYEEYFNGCTESTAMHVFSVTKSIMGVLLGIAMEQGKIKSLDEKIVSFFPDYQVRKREKVLAEVSLKDFITMTVPYRYRFSPYTKYFTSEDQVFFSLNQVGGQSGRIGEFKYAPLIGPDVLSGIIRNVTGNTPREFANETLFAPLGIKEKKDIILHSKEEQMEFYKRTDLNGWVCDRKNNSNAGWGLHLTVREMADIGEMMRSGGLIDGKQIVPKKWILDSTTVRVRPENIPSAYGYLWWIIDEGERAYAAMGDGGNTLYVNESRELVIAINGIFKPRAKDRIGFIREVIEPLM